jgi:transcriptional regulator with XRE-family HTH domain
MPPRVAPAPTPVESGFDLVRLGGAIRDERERRQLSLADLSDASGVSRSMLSAVERGTKAATVIVLDRIATGLGTTLARLLGDERRSSVILLRRGEQDVAHDPSGWERRILSPVIRGVEFELMRTTIDAGVDAGEFLAHARGSREYVAVEKGTLVITLDGTSHTLRAGDSIYYDGDCLHGFANRGRTACVYYLAMDVAPAGAGAVSHARQRRRS